MKIPIEFQLHFKGWIVAGYGAHLHRRYARCEQVQKKNQLLWTQLNKVTQTIVGRFGKTFNWDLKARMMGQRQHEAAQLLVSELQLP